MTTSDTSPVLRWSLMVALGAATIGMVVVSMRANYLFGYGFGQTPEKAQVFGWANVAADLWKVCGLVLIGRLRRARHRWLASMLFPVWLLCLAWGLIGAIGIYAQDRATVIGARQSMATTVADAEREIADIDRRVAGLTVRSVEQVEAAIATVLARPVQIDNHIRGTVAKLSANCTRELRATATACLEIARLREELSGANEVLRYQGRRAEIAGRLDMLRARGGTAPPDPTAEILNWISGGQIQAHGIAIGFPLVFALLIEMISAFGPAGLIAYVESTRAVGKGSEGASVRAATNLGTLCPAVASSGVAHHVALWMAERTEPTMLGSAESLELLHADFAAWSQHNAIEVVSRATFQRALDQLCEMPELRSSIRKLGNRYDGIQLLGTSALTMQKRRMRWATLLLTAHRANSFRGKNSQ